MSEIMTAAQRMMLSNGFCESNEFYMQAEIDDLRAALAERDAKLAALEEDRVYWMAQSDGWRTRAVKAECKVAAIELQEPAGTVDYAYDGAFRGLERKDGPTIKVGQNLYAAAGAAPAPVGKVLVPLRMTPEMQRVTDEEDWTWADLLAAAEAVTEDQYAAAGAAPEWGDFIEIACARIKSADDSAADGDYMLDSEDCIKVLRGTWGGNYLNDHPVRPAAGAAPAPEGWQLVPVEPTQEMRDVVRREMSWCLPVDIYKKMLAAAPKEQP